MNIDFITFVSGDVADYANFLRKTASTFMSGKNTINWKYVESVGLTEEPEGYLKVAKTGNANHSSFNHSLALNEAANHIDADYVMYVDADIAILCQDWDEIIIKELNKVDCFGFGFGRDNPRHSNFPGVFLFAFKASMLDKLILDFRPKLRDKNTESVYRYSLIDPKEAGYMGKKVGEIIKCDTGWQIPNIVGEAGCTWKALSCVLGKDKRHKLPFKDSSQKQFCLQKPEHMCEWHYNGELFGTHKQACRNHRLNSEWGRTWVNRINLYTKNRYNISID